MNERLRTILADLFTLSIVVIALGGFGIDVVGYEEAVLVNLAMLVLAVINVPYRINGVGA